MYLPILQFAYFLHFVPITSTTLQSFNAQRSMNLSQLTALCCVVLLLHLSAAGSLSFQFQSAWNGSLETFVAEEIPTYFQPSADSILNVRQLHFESMEWSPIV